MSCNSRFELCLGIFWYFLKKNDFRNKTAPFMERSGSTSEIHVQCRTLWSVVNCWIRYNVVNCATFLCIRLSCTLRVSTYPQKKKKKQQTRHSPYKVPFLTPSCVVSQYVLGSLWNVHYFLWRMVLIWTRYMLVVGFPKVYQCILGIIYFRGFASFSMFSYDMNRRYRKWVP